MKMVVNWQPRLAAPLHKSTKCLKHFQKKKYDRNNYRTYRDYS